MDTKHKRLLREQLSLSSLLCPRVTGARYITLRTELLIAKLISIHWQPVCSSHSNTGNTEKVLLPAPCLFALSLCMAGLKNYRLFFFLGGGGENMCLLSPPKRLYISGFILS